MDNSPEKAVTDLLHKLNIPFSRREHPPVYTVEQARLYDDVAGGLHCKNLFLRDKKGRRYFLAVCEQSTPLDLKALGERIGVRGMSLASPLRLMSILQIEPGAVGPFSLLNDSMHAVEVLVDRTLNGAASLGFHPNVNTATLHISWAGLVTFLEHLDYDFRWID